MNRISNVIVLAAVATVGFSAAARSMTAPRVEVRPGAPVEVKPTPRTAPSETTLDRNATTLEQLRGAQVPSTAEATFQNQNGQACDAKTYAGKLAEGTTVSYADALHLISKGYIKMGVCGANEGGLLGYSADARTSLLMAMKSVSAVVSGRSVSQMTAVEKQQAHEMMGKAFADALNRNGGNKTEAEGLAVAEKVARDCQLIPAL